ncbi:hypothetical protein GFK26_03705 [Variovorax paradoxus]|jgi:hypothetical protein|uniref:Redoxin domain-containing protein n=1 Tax=Variovorax paradoxus TaxID=34073 RepID=A0A5Q0LXK5_VARPD|nr:hypothetical protein GFK26_03705 [Variovorax paradoxus]
MTTSASRRARRSVAAPDDKKLERRRIALVFCISMLLGVPAAILVPSKSQQRTSQFQLIDITGAGYARDLQLPDQNSAVRSLKDFKGEVVVVFFGLYTRNRAGAAALASDARLLQGGA